MGRPNNFGPVVPTPKSFSNDDIVKALLKRGAPMLDDEDELPITTEEWQRETEAVVGAYQHEVAIMRSEIKNLRKNQSDLRKEIEALKSTAGIEE